MNPSPGAPTYHQLSKLPDEDLIAAAVRENHDALAVLFDRYQRLVFHVARRIVQDEAEAEDLTQEVFFEIYRKASLYDPQRGSVKVWLLQYAYHRSFSRKTALARRQRQHEPAALTVPGSLTRAYERAGLTDHERAWAIREALASAEKRQRRTIELALMEQLTVREIADRTAQSFGNVRHYYYRGIQHLKAMLCGRDSRP